MLVSLPYGKSTIEVDVPGNNLMAVAVPPRPLVPALDEQREIQEALDNPVGSPPLQEVARGKRSAAILVSDYTRPTPSGKLVPPILAELQAAGMDLDDVSIVFAAGAHRPTRPEEMRAILGEETFSRVRCLSHDCDAPDLVYVGTTTVNNTPVWMNREVVEADLRISISGIEPHQGAGWSGGAKNVLPGACGRKTIMTHHSMLTRPDVRMGVLEGNPFREDLEEATALVGLEFILGVILTEKKQICRAFSGHWIDAHRAAVQAADELLSFRLQEPADIVLASVGGAPRDSNWWQTDGKGLSRIPHAVRNGGVVIMVSECTEGMGHPELAKALLEGSVDEVLERFKTADFTVVGNKAYRLASQLKRTDVYLVTSGLKAADFGQLSIKLFSSVEEALAKAFEKLGRSAKVVVVPRTPGVLLRV